MVTFHIKFRYLTSLESSRRSEHTGSSSQMGEEEHSSLCSMVALPCFPSITEARGHLPFIVTLVKVKVLVAQLGPILFDSMDYSLPGSGSWNSPGKNTGVDSHSLLLYFYCCIKISTEIVVYTYFFFYQK